MHQAVMETVLTSNKASYVNGEQPLVEVTVTDGTGPVDGVAVHIEMTTANGLKLAGESTTDADGLAKLSYKVNTERDGVGTYIVNATASKHGFEPAGGSTTFEVTN